MRKMALILCAALILSLFAGCSDDGAYVPTGDALEDAGVPAEQTEPSETQPQEAKLFTLAYYPADGFNPYLCTGITNRMIFSLLYQGLFTVDRSYNAEPVLCKNYSMSEDMKQYTFYLEPATFSDGSRLSAGDVVASLNAAWESDVYAGRFEHIVSIESLGADSVTVTADCSYENLPLLLDVPILKAEQVGDQMPVGTGPYSVIYFAGGMTLQRRSNWWCQAELPVQSEYISLWAASNPVQIRDRFEFEDLGVAYADPGAASHADYRCDYEVWDCETGIMLYLGCNINGEVFSNDEVRAALTYAIDREILLKECYNGFGQAAVLPASAGSPYYDKGLASQINHDPNRLKQALEGNALTGSPIILLVNKSDSVRLQAARLISEMLTQCGLDVQILEKTTEQYKENLKSGNFDLYLGQTQLSANMDLSEFFRPWGELSYGTMSNAACYALCKESLENIGNYYTLHHKVLQNGQLTPVLFRNYAVYMKRGLLEGMSPSRDNVFWYSVGKSMEQALITP